MMMTRDDVMRKVRALLRLGESDNEHESAAAIGRAQALMEQHSIEEAMISVEDTEPEEEIKNWDDPLGRAGAQWRGQLAMTLARANGCGTYRSGNVYKLYGRASQVSAVRYLFGYCEAEIERLVKQYAGNGRTWLNNYRHGCVQAIRDSIRAEREATRSKMRENARATEGALVVVEQAIVAVDNQRKDVLRWGRTNLRLRTASGSGSRYNSGARDQGRSDGANIYPGSSGGSPSIGRGTRRLT